MNVLVITSTFPRTTRDSQVPWLGVFVRRLKDNGERVSVFAPSYRGLGNHDYFGIPVFRFRYAPQFLEILTHDEGALFKLRQKPWLFIVSISYVLFGTVAVLLHLLRYKYDIIHVQWPFPNGVFGIAAKLFLGPKLVLTFHGAEFTLVRKIPWGRKLLELILSFADAVTANSSYTKKQLLGVFNKKVYVIPFGVSVEESGTIPVKSDRAKRSVLYVGRLIERKGVTYLIRAMKHVVSRIPFVRLSIVGNGALYKSLEREAQSLGLSYAIHFYTGIPEKDLVSFYQTCDVFVLPSIVDQWGDTEGLGVVLLEAMGFGKPVVASRVGGIPDIVTNRKTGLLAAPADSRSLANALVRVLSDRALARRLGKNGRVFVRRTFTWDRILSDTLSMYRKCLRL